MALRHNQERTRVELERQAEELGIEGYERLTRHELERVLRWRTRSEPLARAASALADKVRNVRRRGLLGRWMGAKPSAQPEPEPDELHFDHAPDSEPVATGDEDRHASGEWSETAREPAARSAEAGAASEPPAAATWTEVGSDPPPPCAATPIDADQASDGRPHAPEEGDSRDTLPDALEPARDAAPPEATPAALEQTAAERAGPDRAAHPPADPTEQKQLAEPSPTNTGPSRIECEARDAQLAVRWQVTEHGEQAARALLGRAGQLTLRLITLVPDAELVVRSHIQDHAPVPRWGEWTTDAPESDGRGLAAIGLSAEGRFVSIAHAAAAERGSQAT